MKLSNETFVWLCGLIIFGVTVVLLGISGGWFESDSEITIADNRLSSGSTQPHDAQKSRPNDTKTSDQKGEPSAVSTANKPTNKQNENRGARSDAVDSKDGSPPTGKSKGQNLNEPNRPLALPPGPKPFDKQEYLKDPEKYVSAIDPKRVYQFLEPGPDVPELKRDGEYFHDMIQGESVTLRVTAEPNMPVTFLTPRFGQFENRLRTVTVRADENGSAEARYTATSGTHGVVDITAASPTSSGQVTFRLRVVLPEKPITNDDD